LQLRLRLRLRLELSVLRAEHVAQLWPHIGGQEGTIARRAKHTSG